MGVQKYWKPQLRSAKLLEQFVLASFFSMGFCNSCNISIKLIATDATTV